MAKQPISENELVVLKVLWKAGPCTVREVLSKLRGRRRRWAYNTVATLLTRLRDKAYLATENRGSRLVYRAAVSKEGLLNQSLKKLADELCDGLSAPLVQTLVRSGKFTDEDIASFRAMLDRLDEEADVDAND